VRHLESYSRRTNFSISRSASPQRNRRRTRMSVVVHVVPVLWSSVVTPGAACAGPSQNDCAWEDASLANGHPTRSLAAAIVTYARSRETTDQKSTHKVRGDEWVDGEREDNACNTRQSTVVRTLHRRA
jgi:hypothetical protein